MNSQLMKYHVFNRQGSLLFTKVFNWGFFYCSYDSCFWTPSVEMKRRILAYLKTFDSRKGIPLPIITISFYYYHFFLWIRTIFAGFFFPNPALFSYQTSDAYFFFKMAAIKNKLALIREVSHMFSRYKR